MKSSEGTAGTADRWGFPTKEDELDSLYVALCTNYPGDHPKDPRVAGELVARLPNRVHALVGALIDTKTDHYARIVAALALGHLGQGTSALIRVLQMREEEPEQDILRSNAADALRLMKDPDALEALNDALLHDSHEVRKAAAYALSQLGGPGFAALLSALEIHPREAFAGLAWCRGPEAFDAVLTPALDRDGDFGFRVQAIHTLGRIGDSRALEVLTELFRDTREETSVRAAALTGLGMLKDARSLDLLIAALDDRESALSLAAINALGEFGDPRAVRPLLEHLHLGGLNVVVALERLDHPRARQALRDLRDRLSAERPGDPLVRHLDAWLKRPGAS